MVLVRDKNDENMIPQYSHNNSDGLDEIRHKIHTVNGYRNSNIWFNSFQWNDGFIVSVNGMSFMPTTVAVFFCGKIYGGLVLRDIKYPDGTTEEYSHTKPMKVRWSRSDFEEFVLRKTGKAATSFYGSRNNYGYRVRPQTPFEIDYKEASQGLDQVFMEYDANESLMDFVRENRISIITFHPTFGKFGIEYQGGWNWYINHDDLGRLEFFKKFDSYQAFQELSMWIGNLSQPGSEMYQLSDDELIAKHGFDKWSFRKMPAS